MIKFWSCLVLLLWSTLANAQSAIIHHYSLKNGLTLLVKEDHRSPAIVSMVWYRVGSAYEPYGITGISHALEHMMFQGTPLYPKGQFSKTIAMQGGEENAFTSQDYTVYFEKLDRSLLSLAFQLESDRMQHLSLKEEHFKKEIQVVREERRMRTDDNPQAFTYERFMASAYLSTPYHHPTIGWPDDLANLNIFDVRRWYHTWYAPNNAIIVVVGDVDAEKVFQQAKHFFEAIPSKKLPPFKTHHEPTALGERDIIIKKEAQLPWVLEGFVVPSRVSDPSSWKPYALTVLQAILDAGNSARLTKHLIQKKQIASQAAADYDMYSLYETTFLLYGAPSEKHTTKELKTAFLQEIKKLQNTLVSEAELQRVKNLLLANRIYNQDALFEQALEIGSLASIGLPPTAGETDMKKIQAITPQQIQQVAQEYLTPERLVRATLIPQPSLSSSSVS